VSDSVADPLPAAQGGSAAIRVCHLVTMLELGGAQRNTLYTVSHLDRRRFAAVLIAGPGGILDDEAGRLAGVVFEKCPYLVREIAPARDLAAFFDLWRRLRRLRPAIVHTHSSKAGILGRAAAFLAGVPVIVHTVHGWGFSPAQPWLLRGFFARLEQASAMVTRRLVVVAEANARSGVALGIAPPERFTVIRSGIELAAHRASANSGRLRKELGLDPRTPLAGMVACFKPQKAPLDFVALAARTLRSVPAAHFVLAGDGAMRGAIEDAVRSAGVGERFHLLGWRPDPEVVIGDLDVLVLTSLHEGLPRVVPEAMAAGKPVVATSVDGTPEAVRDGETGFLHPVHDVDNLAASVTRLLENPGLAVRLGRRGAELAGEWDIDEMVRRQERLYGELLDEAGFPQLGCARPDPGD
jgi:glycosyltransferase involved in cell wall biosynthesis